MIAISEAFRFVSGDEGDDEDQQDHRGRDVLPAGAPQDAGADQKHELNVPTDPIDAVHPAEAEQLGNGQGERDVGHSVVVHVVDQAGTGLKEWRLKRNRVRNVIG